MPIPPPLAPSAAYRLASTAREVIIEGESYAAARTHPPASTTAACPTIVQWSRIAGYWCGAV
jgi:hypothetical protein